MSYIQGVKDPSEAQEESEISLKMPQCKRASARVEERISWFFSSCSRKLGVPLELEWGPHGCTHVASGKFNLHASSEGQLRIPLQSVLGPTSSCVAEAGSSGFLSSADMYLGLPLESSQGSQASFHVETCTSPFLSSGKRSVRLPVELT